MKEEYLQKKNSKKLYRGLIVKTLEDYKTILSNNGFKVYSIEPYFDSDLRWFYYSDGKNCGFCEIFKGKIYIGISFRKGIFFGSVYKSIEPD